MKFRLVVVLSAVLQTSFWMLVLMADPFGVSSAADRASESIFLKLYSFAYPSFAPARVRDDIAIVRYDDKDLPRVDTDRSVTPEWPLPYSTHAQLLARILELKPKAVFFDILFDTEMNRGGAGVAQSLLDAIPPGAAPVFFASYADGSSKLAEPFQNLPALKVAGPLPRAGAYRVIVESKPTANHYLLSTAGGLTPAAALYGSTAKKSGAAPLPADAAAQEILVAWGATLPNRYRLQPDAFPDCAPYYDGAWGRFGGLLQAISIALDFRRDRNADRGWNKLQPCAYHTSVSAAKFFNGPNAQVDAGVRRLIRNSYVLVGADIAGSGDEIVSPVSGKLPGVYLHAMALDNLLSFKGWPIVTGSGVLYQTTQAVLIFVAMILGGAFFEDRPLPANRAGALKAILARLAAWLIFAAISAVMLFEFLVWLHWAPYNWGAVLAAAASSFLPGMVALVLIAIRGDHYEGSFES